MTALPQVTVCVPVHNGAEFVAETLRSIARQTYPNLKLLISDDASTDGSAELCRRYADEHGCELLLQTQRRGWIENCNLLLSHAGGDFVCIVPHDDLLQERYVEVLAAHLSAKPECVQAFCDIRAFGSSHDVLSQPSLVGRPFERLYQLLTRHFDGTPFRGLIRRSVLDRAGGLPGNGFDGFAADICWVARLAVEGEIHRVPEILYFKRMHPRSTAYAWGLWPEDATLAAWVDHCAHLLGVTLELDLSPAERWLILHAAARRLIMANEQRGPFPAIRHLPLARKAEMVGVLLACFESPLSGGGGTAEERRRLSTAMVEALSAENVAATIRAIEAPGHADGAAPRTPANLLRFLRKKPMKLR